MTDDHDRYRDWAAAYVLGALEPRERSDWERHLRTCRTCQADVNDFAALPGLLALVDPGDQQPATTGHEVGEPAAARVTELAVARAGHDYAQLRRRNRQWRLATLVAAVSAAILLVAVSVGAARGGGAPSPGTAGAELAVDGGDTTGTIRFDPRAWGTSIELDLVGLPNRSRYQLWAVDTDGSWTIAATWAATPRGRARLTGAAAVPTDAIDRVIITSTDRDDVVLTAST